MVQLGPLACTRCSRRSTGSVTTPRSPPRCPSGSGARCEVEHVVKIAEKLAEQGLLAGSEENAPPRSNPLLALRWKVLFTDPKVTGRITAPFKWLFRPWIVLPALVGFAAVFWFVLIHKGVAPATAQAFDKPGAAAARPRPHGRVGGVPRDRARGRLPLRRRPPGRHGRRHLRRLARLLHGRDRRLPAAAPRPPAHRPRRHLLQRRRRGASRSASGSRPASTRCCC